MTAANPCDGDLRLFFTIGRDRFSATLFFNYYPKWVQVYEINIIIESYYFKNTSPIYNYILK